MSQSGITLRPLPYCDRASAAMGIDENLVPRGKMTEGFSVFVENFCSHQAGFLVSNAFGPQFLVK